MCDNKNPEKTRCMKENHTNASDHYIYILSNVFDNAYIWNVVKRKLKGKEICVRAYKLEQESFKFRSPWHTKLESTV